MKITNPVKSDKTDLFALAVLGMLGLGILNLGLFGFNTIALLKIGRKSPPTLVQLSDGQAIGVTPMDSLDRTPETINHFVSQTLTLMFNWSGKLPQSNFDPAQLPKRDPGVDVQFGGSQFQSSNHKVATASWEASFALSTDFRAPFLQQVAQLMPEDVLTSNTQVVLLIRNISKPEPIAAGTWKEKMVADLIYFDHEHNSGNAIPFNKEVFVRSVLTPLSPLGDAASPLEKAVYNIRQAGLEIYAIRDLKRENL